MLFTDWMIRKVTPNSCTHDWHPSELMTVDRRTMQPTSYRRRCKNCNRQEDQKITYNVVRSDWASWQDYKF